LASPEEHPPAENRPHQSSSDRKRHYREKVTMAQAQRRHYRRGIDTAISLLKAIGRRDGPCRVGELGNALGIPHASLHRIVRALSEHGVVAMPRRGWIVAGPICKVLASRFEANARREDDRLIGRKLGHASIGRAGYGLLRNPESCRLTSTTPFRRPPKYRIGFSNAALDSPWRTALVHAVEFGSAKRCDLVSSLTVLHAAHDVARQIADIEALVEAGVDGLVVSALDGDHIGPVIARAAQRGIPTVLVDRGIPSAIPHASFVACDDWMIGRTMARWLAEYLGGHGGVVLLPGDERAEPAQRRVAGALSVFAEFPQIRILATQWTNWQRESGYAAMRTVLATRAGDIAGVWCDSGLQAAGSLLACIENGRRHAVPPHTGGDLNLTYKLAVRHRVPLSAVNYPPAMGLRAIEVLLDVLRGRSVPLRVDVATEVVVTRGHATHSVRPDVWADEHVRWDLPDELILATGLGPAYNPRAFRVHYGGNRYNRSAASAEAVQHAL
jgi:ABC-type sugar transport system substrate-binding protein